MHIIYLPVDIFRAHNNKEIFQLSDEGKSQGNKANNLQTFNMFSSDLVNATALN